MRIGKIMIDTDNMDSEELRALEQEFRRIRKRKEQAENLSRRLNELIIEAKDEGFTFVDKDFGQVIMGDDFTVFDEQK